MRCDFHDAGFVPAFLAGDFEGDPYEAFEDHLLRCDECWTAVREDRRGRFMAEALRETAPAGLAERVALSVELATATRSRARRARSRRWRPGLAVAATVVGVLFAADWVAGGGDSGNPQIISQVVQLATSTQAGGPSASGAERRVGSATVTALTVDGSTVVVARSAVAFPMPSGAVPMTSAVAPWIARRGTITLVCFNAPHPLLAAAALPADRLVALADQLDR